MTDFFALLNEPHRPWVEPERLKAKFLKLAAEAHPDKQHGLSEAERGPANRHYAELNAAYHCLADPKSRLRHLLELELGAKPKEVQPISNILADLFAEVATTCRDADTFLAEKGSTTSPLLQVQFFERAQEWVDHLNLLQRKLNEWRENLTDELKSLDKQWRAAGADAAHGEILPKLEELYRLFSYCNRWSSQTQERIVQLTL